MKEGDRPAFKRPLSWIDGINLVTSRSSKQLWIITRRWAVDGWVRRVAPIICIKGQDRNGGARTAVSPLWRNSRSSVRPPASTTPM